MCKRCASDLGKTKLKDLASAEAFVRSVFNDEAGASSLHACACCAFEGPRSGFKPLSSLKERGCLNWHGHSKRTIVQTLMGSSFLYDHRYGMALDTGLDEYGMLPGLKVS